MVSIFQRGIWVISLVVMLSMAMPPIAAEASPTASIAALPGFKAVFSGTRPDNLGIHEGMLAPCPSTPNCVVSQGADAQHAIAPLTYTSADPAVAMTTLRQVVERQPRSEIITEGDRYLYAEFTSRLMGFVDDVEFYADPAEPGVIQVRAAARLGESDLGVNRKRIETIRAAFEAAEG